VTRPVDFALALPSNRPRLTQREGNVLELVAAGFSSRLAAHALHVSAKDIDYHISNLITKFQASNRTGVVGRAFVLGNLNSNVWPPRIAQEASSSITRYRSPERGER
jgi:ATP/maltotriose-dependent transcriptional regulator MalT